MLKWILDWFAGGPIREIKDGLLQAQRQNLESKTKESEQNLRFWEARMVLATEAAKNDKWWSPRTLMGWGATLYVLKIVVWDTVLQLGVTPNPGEQVTFIVMTVVSFYYGSKAAENIASILSNRIAR